jgi:hypothetical protein
MAEPTPEAVAELLRTADFALERSNVALVAFTNNVKAVGRDFDRNREVRRRIKAMLEHLPPKPPLTPEQEAECLAIISEALQKRFGPPITPILSTEQQHASDG